MIELGPASEHEMVLAFLKAEIDASRYHDVIQSFLECLAPSGLTRDELIDRPNLSDEHQNQARLWILQEFRGYRKNQFLFSGFPLDAVWRRVGIEPHELHRLRYAKELHWLAFSDNTRKPSRMAENILTGKVPKEDADRVFAIQEALKKGKRFPELIAAEGQNDELILLEGHSRATAYVACGFNENITMLIASSPTMDRWHYY
jgi:hypothetical protein